MVFRTALQKDIYHYAVQSGWTHQPGSVIEDRQYQIDVRGISFSSVAAGRAGKPSGGSMVQIPALDWNHVPYGQTHDRKDILIIPIATPLTSIIVVAPPISYVPQTAELDFNKRTLLICGLSTELNLTSHLDLYISTSQIKLISDITNQIPNCSITRPDVSTPHSVSGITLSPLLRRSPLTRSGLNQISQQLSSEGRGRENRRHQPKIEIVATNSFPYFQLSGYILVTASRISCSVYTHKLNVFFFKSAFSWMDISDVTNAKIVSSSTESTLKCYRCPMTIMNQLQNEEYFPQVLDEKITLEVPSLQCWSAFRPESIRGQTYCK
ncbi:hypothetical protein Btru_020462 [Bulinus truncatus]|nr:hypothetical protein Btru_020462 [Bulinus truncatus]